MQKPHPDILKLGNQFIPVHHYYTFYYLENYLLFPGSLGGAAVWRLPLAQGAILETRDRIPCRAPGAWSLLLPLPVSLALSLLLSLKNK